jgi:NAD(P)-dependent dehydrogenase (short-subunit alcohol dehydrogenase family)
VSAEKSRPVALVTGARRGIGRACCLALAARGFDLVALDIEAGDALQATVDQVRASGAEAKALIGDIAALDRHAAMLAAAERAFGRLDCLVNNAGVSVLDRGDLLDASVESYDRCLAINTRGPFFLTQAFARRLVAAPPTDDSHRSVVFITSVNAEAVSTNRGEYCVSKAGLSMVAKLFAARLAAAGIGVYEIRPGVIRTDMTAPSKERYDHLFANDGAPIPRWGEAADVGRVVATAASGDLPYTVGLAIPVDGGLGMRRL